ncbi:hypothetical protein RZS08_63460, partial [Arthrospira platensis SPKY1]|nr:hypothetical protein [Arthrospira platensis SPKY1]
RGYGKYHLDHIIPIYYGFTHNIDPCIIANIENLQMLPAQDNFDKGSRLTPQSIQKIHEFGLEYTLELPYTPIF